ncbi:MAG TPA: NADH-quinone oxidoreductase subunit NuoG [Acidimicrobiales bacterium]|nr:NADH-quinone oxidoreductase subunit NuoG [Acidimicrobiales bacterium]
MSDQRAPAETVVLSVNGKEIEAKPGELVIEAAERNGTYIPRFCYHPRMEPVGMCRMCIVEIDTGRGPALQPSCMIECADGMSVSTDSPVTRKAQEGVLEFLLVNHPLDCPVCDKGGECPLQDQTMSYGPGESRFVEEKRHFEKPIPVSELVLLDRERCILCDRCTRFADEVAGDPLISFMDRGNQTQVNTFPDHPFASYFSGNTVQICPVGALTAVPYRFKARPWDLDQVESTCTSCSVGCRVVVQSSRNRVLRYLGVDADAVNWGWLCDKGRFDFEAVNSEERLGSPLVRDEGLLLKPATWNEALRKASEAIRAGLDRSGPAGFAVLGGARLTNESQYAWVKLAKGVIGSDNVDVQMGDGLPPEAVLGLPRATIDDACRPGGTVLLLGPDLKEELPVLFLRLRHAVRNDGVKVIELASTETGVTGLAAESLRYRPGHALPVVRAVLAGEAATEVAGVSADAIRAAGALLADGPVTVVLGRSNLAESGRSIAAAAAAIHHTLADVRFLSALRRANVHGGLELGMAPGVLPGRVALDAARSWFGERWPTVPGAKGLDASGILRAAADGKIDTLVLLGADPLADFPDRDLAERGLTGARTVIAADQFLTESVKQADVVLPAAGYAEVDGTTTNLEGRVSTVSRKVTSPGTSQPNWAIAADIARRLGTDLGLESPGQIGAEIAAVAPAFAGLTHDLLVAPGGEDGVLVALPGRRTNGSEPVTGGAGDVTAEAGTGGDGAGDTEAADTEAADTDAPSDAAAAAEPGPEAPPVGVPLPVWTIIDPPSLDAYSLRLVVTRKLYDRGTLVRSSPSLAELAEPAMLRLNPHDFDRLGVAAGDDVRITSGRGHVTVPTVPDDGVPRSTAHIHFNLSGGRANVLIDGNTPVTDVRVERP